MGKHIIYVGLDVHKDTIAIALAETGKRGEVREHGKVVNTPTALKTLAVKLARDGARLRFCYEAGPCGYGIQRQLSEAGHECVVVAPSLIPRKPGDRIKTDRRDAINLAKLHRAGELSSVWVPDPAHEAIRERARLAAVRVVRQARQQLCGFLLRHGHHYNAPVRPRDAFFHNELKEFILPYDLVRRAKDPDALLLDFLQSAYEVAAVAGHWDRAALEASLGQIGVP